MRNADALRALLNVQQGRGGASASARDIPNAHGCNKNEADAHGAEQKPCLGSAWANLLFREETT